MMRILFVSPRQCWPALSGAKLREYHFVRALGRISSLTYIYFADPSGPALKVSDLPFCERIIRVPKPRAYTPWKIMQGLAGRQPLTVLNYTSTAMSAAIRSAMQEPYDLIHLDSIHMAAYAKLFGSFQVVYNWHNIESEAMHRYSETAQPLARKLYARETARRIAMLEREILKTAYGHIVCSHRELDELRRLETAARVAVVENGVDTAYFDRQADHGAYRETRNSLVFVGLMNYAPNIDAAVSFARTIWPGVLARFPALRLRIVGANPAPAVLALRELPGIDVTGTVPDVRPYYGDAVAAIVPLRTGGGTRLKILEAMAAGVPVISSPLGAEGLRVEPDRDILIAPEGNASAWVDHIERLSSSPLSAHTIAAAARNLVQTQYDWEILGARLSRTYEEWVRKTG